MCRHFDTAQDSSRMARLVFSGIKNKLFKFISKGNNLIVSSQITIFTFPARVAIQTCARVSAQIVVGACGTIFTLFRIEIAWQDF
jgi:hypothetical protein